MRMRVVPVLAIVLAACDRPGTPAAGSTQAANEPAAPATVMDQRLFAAARIALPPDFITLDSLPDATGAGARLAATYCTQCHAIPAPAMHASQDWPSVLRRMWVRIDMMHGELGVAVPTSAERVQLLDYMLANALQVAQHLPEGPGKATFEATCSRCHLLPDPHSHSSADWPAVILRMERNMERMRVGGVSSDQAQAIIGYLQRASVRTGD